MNWVKPEFGDFLAPPPKKRKNTDDIQLVQKGKKSENLKTQINFNQLTKYTPKTKEDLVVNKKKVEEVEYYLRNIEKEGTFLLITGPPGCGKLKAISVLCKSLNIDCVEWTSPATTVYDPDNPSLYQSEMECFLDFIVRASRYTNILCPSCRRLVVVKDIPNIFYRDNSSFQSFLESYFDVKYMHIVFIVSDNVICRNLFPEQLKVKFNIKTINFNPITQKGVATALSNIIKKFDISRSNPQAETYANEVSVMCNGDLRNALTMLHFLLAKVSNSRGMPPPKRRKGKGNIQKNQLSSIDSMTNLISDNKLDIFHGLGRVLYAKRENDKLVHHPQEVAESFTSSPNLFVGMLHENYLHTFSSIHDIAKSSVNLAASDLLLQDWNENSMLLGSGVSVASHGLMVFNSLPVKKFRQFNKSQIKHNTLLSDSKVVLESSNPCWKGSDILLDIAPYAINIPYLNFDCKDILANLARFSS